MKNCLNYSKIAIIGYFHQRIFQYITKSYVPEKGKEGGWDVIYKNADGVTLPDGDVVHNVYVEMKNKHNTMNSASAGKSKRLLIVEKVLTFQRIPF